MNASGFQVNIMPPKTLPPGPPDLVVHPKRGAYSTPHSVQVKH